VQHGQQITKDAAETATHSACATARAFPSARHVFPKNNKKKQRNEQKVEEVTTYLAHGATLIFAL